MLGPKRCRVARRPGLGLNLNGPTMVETRHSEATLQKKIPAGVDLRGDPLSGAAMSAALHQRPAGPRCRPGCAEFNRARCAKTD